MGWLNSTVKIKSRDGDKSKSKIEYFGADSLIAEMPDVKNARYIVQHWHDLGRCEYIFTSYTAIIEPLKWSEIRAFAEIVQLSRWEQELLHMMSRVFAQSKRMFDDVMCECPYRYKDKPMLELQLLASKTKIPTKAKASK